MKLKILGSSSSGNCYILQNKNETLILECGINFKEVKKALGFNLSNVIGVLITHEHGDHSKYVRDFIVSGIDIYASKGTIDGIGINSHRIHDVEPMKAFTVGEFKILPFDTKHDCNEPLGFLINHPETGNILFATDTYFLEYTFNNLSHILIECNYSLDILNDNIDNGLIHPARKERILKSHLELENVVEFLKANDLREVKNIVLLHLSDQNSNEKLFKDTIEQEFEIKTAIADKGLEINLDLYPF